MQGFFIKKSMWGQNANRITHKFREDSKITLNRNISNTEKDMIITKKLT